MKIINMLGVGISPPEPFPLYPNLYDDHSFDACIFRQITVSNDLSGNMLSLTQNEIIKLFIRDV